MTMCIRVAPVCTGIALTSGVAIAGPDWTELDDAGGLPETAQVVQVGTLQTISGSLTGRGDDFRGNGQFEDFEDVYLIEIKDVEQFLAETDGTISGGATFPTALYLFDLNGNGILGNVVSPNIPAADRGFSGSLLGPMSDDGSGAEVPDPGMYFLAIAGQSNPPVNEQGVEIFSFDSVDEISGPDGPTGGPYDSRGESPNGKGGIEIGGWEGEGETGSYVIALRGVCGVADPQPVPALSTLGLGSVAGLMGAGGLFVLRRRSA